MHAWLALVASSFWMATASAHAQSTMSTAWTRTLQVQVPSHAVPDGQPHVLVAGNFSIEAGRRFQVLVLFHGFQGCVDAFRTPLESSTVCGTHRSRGYGWSTTVRDARSPVLLVVPQLAYFARDPNPGRFAESGFFRTYLEEVLRTVDASWSLANADSVSLSAHSGGYLTAARSLERGEVTIAKVVLFDALYAEENAFYDWLEASPAERRLVSYTTRGTTLRLSRSLYDRWNARHPRELSAHWFDGDQGTRSLHHTLRAHPLTVIETRISHREIPLQALPLWLNLLPRTAHP